MRSFTPEPDNYERARRLARLEGDFYHLFPDQRFQAWSEGRRRLRLGISAFDINNCEVEPLAGNCDPSYVIKEGDFILYDSPLFWQGKHHVTLVTDFLIADFSLLEPIVIEFWDIDDYDSDDYIGSVLVGRRQLIAGGPHRNTIQNKYGVVGYLSFDIQRTGAERDAYASHINPTIGILSWPIMGCFTEFGIGTLINPHHLKGSLLELNSSFMGEEFTLRGALERFGSLYLKKVLLSSGVRLGVRFAEMLHCVETTAPREFGMATALP